MDTARRNSLVLAARDGDQRAFEKLFIETQSRIYNFIAHLMGDERHAEDLTQATFIRAWETLAQLRSPEAFIVWLHRIARNTVRDHVRSVGSGRPVEVSRDRAGESVIDPEDTRRNGSPERALLLDERDQALRSAILELPEHHREVVALHHLDSMPVQDVAEILGVPVGTVLSRLARARGALHEKLRWLVE